MDNYKTTQSRIAWTPKEVAEKIGMSLGFIRKEIRAKRIKVTKFGSRNLILQEDFEAYIATKAAQTK